MPSSLSDFEIMYTIGSGSYGTCKKVRRKSDGKVFVWKEMDYGSMTEEEKQMLVSEVNLLRELKHEHIVRYHERVVDKKRQILYLIMEYCEGGDLGAAIKRYQKDGRHFDEETIWKTLAQCAAALNECHKRKDGKSILHRDLKPANIFLDSQKNVKLGDFGLARVLHETSFAKTFVGTPYYMSPELMNKLSYNETSDIWSLGCVLYEMCSLRPPFLASNQRELAMKIRIGSFTKIPYRYSSELSKIIDRMLSVECNSRPTIEDLLVHQRVAAYIKPKSPRVPKDPLSARSTGLDEQIQKRLTEVSLRESRCTKKETQLSVREKELKDKEASLRTLEAELQQKKKRLDESELQLKKRMAAAEEPKASGKEHHSDGSDKAITPILCRVKKPLDSPSKHVSFNMSGKENNYAEIRSTIHALQDININARVLRDRELKTYEDYKRKELRERLEKAKQRANQLRAAELGSRVRSHDILNVR